MHKYFSSRALRLAITIGLAGLVLLSWLGPAHAQGFYQQTNLVSNLAGIARDIDPNLRNPWGLSAGPATPWWVADNGTGVSTLYTGNGRPFPLLGPLVVVIPPPPGSPAGTTAAPTGMVFNSTRGFVVSQGSKSGPSLFIFATEDGTIAGWSSDVDETHAILAVNHSAAGAVYKGLAIGSASAGPVLYAANFHAGTIEVFDQHFQPVSLAGSFTDPNLPPPSSGHPGFAPFGIQNINGHLFVTYALQDAAQHDDVAGAGNGFVDVFDLDGHFLQRFASQGSLDSPWGVALAPNDFGPFSQAVLVGNFGDGRINAFNPSTGAFLGQLADSKGTPLEIEGLWGLAFGNDLLAGKHNELFFTAGIHDEADGLFGTVTAAAGQ
jgi:uncharacterized protein (TIGR03118 family)